MTKPSMELTNSPTGLPKRRELFSELSQPLTKMLRCGTHQYSLPPIRTGEDQEKRPQLRIKDHADHAGHSEPTRPSNPDMPSPTDNFSTFPNRNLLTAPLHTETTDVTEDGCTLLTNISKPREESPSNPSTHTTPRMRPVKPIYQLDTLRSLDTSRLERPNLPSKPPSTKDQLLLPLTPPTSHLTSLETSPTVDPLQTTPLLPTDILPPTGSSETLGVRDGVNLDTSTLRKETLVEF